MTGEDPIELRLLVVVNEMVVRVVSERCLEFAPQRFVFQDAIDKGAGWVHAGALGGENSFGEQAQGLGVSFEAALIGHEVVERAFARMTEGRVAEVVGEAGGFDQVGVDEKIRLERSVTLGFEPEADRLANLRDFKRVGEAGAVEIVFAAPENLRFVLQAAEGGRVKDAVAIDLERAAIVAGILPTREAFGVEISVEAVLHAGGGVGFLCPESG